LKSSFKSDLDKEKQLSKLLDKYYKRHLKRYCFKRVSALEEQKKGIDLVLSSKFADAVFYVDEKAQLDYINDSLPTFAFELFYEKNGIKKQGWLFDPNKKTHFYALVTNIYADEENTFTSCSITFINRKKLIEFLKCRGLTKKRLQEIVTSVKTFHGKLALEALNVKSEGYLFFSRKNKAEKPVNLILKLDFLIEAGVGKKFV
jgi:hypothetical protein